MHSRLSQVFLGASLLALLACNGGGDSKAPSVFTGAGNVVSSVTPVFDPTTGNVPLPNILATATAADPITGSWTNPTTGVVTVGNRPAGVPISPSEALAYINLREVGGTNAVAGLNAPIYIQFSAPVDATTVTAANVKVFQITPDAAGTENAALGFSDVSGMFRYVYTAGSKDLLLFPNFPLFPGTRYLYVVTNRVKDTAGLAITPSPYFEALKGTTPLAGSFLGLEAVRANVTSSGQILLSGYAKVMDDLITASTTTTVTSRATIAVMGRFITTGAGFIPTDATNATTQAASRIPVESALRAFAAGSTLGGLPGKTWTNAITVPANTSTAFYTFDRSGSNPTPEAYFAAVSGNAITSAPGISTVVLGTINSADIGVDPALVRTNAASADMTGVTGAASPIAAVVQPFRTGAALTSYYHVPRSVPFIYMAPTGTAPATGWPLVIFQHGITSQKESVFTIAQTLAAVGYAVVAIDMPLHGALQVTGHTTGSQWGQDFMAVGAPLTGRSNFQQGAFNLNRLELTVRAGGFAGLGAAKPSQAKISFIGHSLGSMVGAYYLAGNTTMTTTAGQPPYSQTSLDADMKGYLSVPGGRTAYVIQNGAFGPTVDAGLAAVGVAKGSPSYHQFFLVTQTVIDPCDPATMTTPLAVGLPSRLSNRVVIQESTSTAFSATLGTDGYPMPTNGDLVITNPYTRYFGNALGGRAVLGLGASAANAAAAANVGKNFSQLAYSNTTHTVTVPSQFMKTLSIAGAPIDKVGNAAASATAATPTEGYFQFDQTNIGHSSLLDLTNQTNSLGLTQKQMRYFISLGTVVDPYFPAPALPIQGGLVNMEVQVAPRWDILGH
ncbi:MAG: hypothetical protein HGB30_06450 [Holophagaceae bacterium]|nr:hypothetical protein [Holophagaceae bacterium]